MPLMGRMLYRAMCLGDCLQLCGGRVVLGRVALALWQTRRVRGRVHPKYQPKTGEKSWEIAVEGDGASKIPTEIEVLKTHIKKKAKKLIKQKGKKRSKIITKRRKYNDFLV